MADKKKKMPFREKTYFFGVGAQKCGTTWLHRYLSDHPDCYMSPIKEMHFFDEMFLPDLCQPLADVHYDRLVDIVGRLRKVDEKAPTHRVSIAHDLLDRMAMRGSIPAYFDFFRKRVEPKQHVFGEISPSYSMMRAEHFAQVAKHHADIRPIFLVRDPVDRFWSSLRMTERDRPGFKAIENIDRQLRNANDILRGRYDLTLKALTEVFGDKVLVLYYEELFRDESIAQVCKFLGLSEHPADFERRENVSSPGDELPEAEMMKIYETFGDVYDYMKKRGDKLPKAWRHKIRVAERATA